MISRGPIPPGPCLVSEDVLFTELSFLSFSYPFFACSWKIGVTCSNCYAYLGSGITVIVEYDATSGKSRAQAGAVGAEIMLGGAAGTVNALQ